MENITEIIVDKTLFINLLCLILEYTAVPIFLLFAVLMQKKELNEEGSNMLVGQKLYLAAPEIVMISLASHVALLFRAISSRPLSNNSKFLLIDCHNLWKYQLVLSLIIIILIFWQIIQLKKLRSRSYKKIIIPYYHAIIIYGILIQMIVIYWVVFECPENFMLKYYIFFFTLLFFCAFSYFIIYNKVLSRFYVEKWNLEAAKFLEETKYDKAIEYYTKAETRSKQINIIVQARRGIVVSTRKKYIPENSTLNSDLSTIERSLSSSDRNKIENALNEIPKLINFAKSKENSHFINQNINDFRLLSKLTNNKNFVNKLIRKIDDLDIGKQLNSELLISVNTE